MDADYIPLNNLLMGLHVEDVDYTTLSFHCVYRAEFMYHIRILVLPWGVQNKSTWILILLHSQILTLNPFPHSKILGQTKFRRQI